MTPQAQRPQIASVDRLLQSESLCAVIARHGRVRVRDALRERLGALRERWASEPASAFEAAALSRTIARTLDDASTLSLRPVANVTGTVLHTNLGRALLPDEAIEAMGRAALRSLPLPVIGRIEDGAVLLDCRCLEEAAPVLLSLSVLHVDG